jgi:DNA-binding NarL/FixJ family response regulator
MTVVVSADSSLIADGLVSVLAGLPDVAVVGCARNLEELPSLVAELHPRAVIVSVRSEVVSAALTVSAAGRLRSAHPDLGIVVISDRTHEFALELLGGGSSGIALLLDERLPGIDALLGALRNLDTGQTGLDPSFLDMLIRRGDVTGIEDLTTWEADVLGQMALDLSAGQVQISVRSIEQGATPILDGLSPFAGSDRQVAAALVYLRAHTDRAEPEADARTPTTPVVFLKETEDVAPASPI